MIKIEFLKPEDFIKFYTENINKENWKNADIKYGESVYIHNKIVEKNDIKSLEDLYMWWDLSRPKSFQNYRSFSTGDKIIWNDKLYIVDKIGFMEIEE